MEKYGLTKVTRRGQITIPAEAREKLGIREDDYVAVYGSESILALKKTMQPDLDKRLAEALRQGMDIAKKKGITRKTVKRAVEEVRYGLANKRSDVTIRNTRMPKEVKHG